MSAGGGLRVGIAIRRAGYVGSSELILHGFRRPPSRAPPRVTRRHELGRGFPLDYYAQPYSSSAMAAADISRDLEPQRSYLLRVARLQLRDEALAEDVVQETLLAALSGTGFSGKSSLRTWLTGILKHKIVDAIRKKQREPTVASSFGDIDAEIDIEDFDALFNERGGWEPKPGEWGNSPEDALNQRQFLDVMDLCLEKLPPNTARVFMMREVMELETDEICKELTINANNLWVILYRARMALRLCLEQNWFARND
jgi:RNA polymerase sigma-70 factor (ECF subfamily)